MTRRSYTRPCLAWAFAMLAVLAPVGLARWSMAAARTAGSAWRSATPEELKAVIPARAPVIAERIETELRTASGITDGRGHFVAGAVLITAGYSAEGKYSHYFVTQVPLKVGDFSLTPGQYILGWARGQDGLKVTFYGAMTGKRIGEADARRDPASTRVESFRIWPPGGKSMIQIGRFGIHYSLSGN